MKIDGIHYRSVWLDRDDGWRVHIFDQTKLPWALEVLDLTDLSQAAHAIRSMQTRGAPLIGAVAAYGVCLGLRADASDAGLAAHAATLGATRPTAVNLHWALARMVAHLRPIAPAARVAAAYAEAGRIADEDAAQCEAIGRYGLELIAEIAARNLRSRMTLQIHDELLFDVIPAEADELQTLVKQEMEHVAEFSVPILAEVGLGPNWRDIK